MEKWTGKIVMLCHMNGIKQKELAEEIGCSREHLNMTLNGHRKSPDLYQKSMEAIQRIIERRKAASNG